MSDRRRREARPRRAFGYDLSDGNGRRLIQFDGWMLPVCISNKGKTQPRNVKKLTWFLSVSKFKGVKKVEEFPDGNLEGIKQPYFGKDSVARLKSNQGNTTDKIHFNRNKSFHMG
jgi:hypothetical protein